MASRRGKVVVRPCRSRGGVLTTPILRQVGPPVDARYQATDPITLKPIRAPPLDATMSDERHSRPNGWNRSPVFARLAPPSLPSPPGRSHNILRIVSSSPMNLELLISAVRNNS